MTLPAHLLVSEFLPTVLSQRKWLTRQSYVWGFQLVTPDGTVLNSGESLVEQGVMPGTLLRLEASAGDDAIRYDDLAEALGDSIATSRTTWKQGDSIRLSSYVASALVVICGFLLVLGVSPIFASIITGVGALVMVLVASVVVRAPSTRDLAQGCFVSLALSASVLFGLCAYALTMGQDPSLQLAAAGAWMIVGSASVLVLPRDSRAFAWIPLTIGAVTALFGLLQWAWQVPDQRAAALLVSVVCLIVLILPWAGMARMATRNDVGSVSHRAIVPEEVTTQVRRGENLTTALRIAAGICLVALTPLVAVDAYGGLLMTAVCLAFLMGTRNLYGRTEVYIGLVSGALGLTLTGVLLAVNRPDLFPWVLVVAAVVAIFIIADNIVSVKLRPRLARAADVVNIAAIVAICPLVVMIWGVF